MSGPILEPRPSHRPRLNSLRSTTSTSSTSHPRPPSPTLSTTTVGSQLPRGSLPPGLLITRADLRSSLQAYEDLMTASKSYRQAILAKARATAELASAMERCARVKGANSSGPGLQAAAGFYFVVSNGEDLLASQFYKSFEIPLLHSLDSYKQETVDRQVVYESSLVTRTKALRDTEEKNIQLGRNKKGKGPGRDLQSFRKTLEQLQRQVDEIDALKSSYHEEVAEGEEEIWEEVLSQTGTVLKTQLNIYDRLVCSMTADAVLEPMLAANPDPFEAYDQPNPESPFQSILPPIGMPSAMTSSSKASPSRALRTTSLSLSQSTNGGPHPLPSTTLNVEQNGIDRGEGGASSEGWSGRSRSISLEGSGEDEDGFLSPRKEAAGFSFTQPSPLPSQPEASSSSSPPQTSSPPPTQSSSDPDSTITSFHLEPSETSTPSHSPRRPLASNVRSRRILSVIGDEGIEHETELADEEEDELREEDVEVSAEGEEEEEREGEEDVETIRETGEREGDIAVVQTEEEVVVPVGGQGHEASVISDVDGLGEMDLDPANNDEHLGLEGGDE